MNDIMRDTSKKLEPEIKRLQEANSKASLTSYDSPYSLINLPFDTSYQKQIQSLVEQKKKLKPAALVVIGIGGSNAGAMAIHQALYGKFYNEQQPDIKVYWVDTVDTDYILDIMLLLEQGLQSGREILINVVSKSGTTVETIANFEIFFDFLRRHRPVDYHKFMVATTDEDSPLWDFAGKHQIDRLPIPKMVGGRYSVFSAVGLFPLTLAGVDIEKLCEGARDAVEASIKSDLSQNQAAELAVTLYDHYNKDFIIHDLFLFSNDLHALGMWYRQLMAESIGKNGVGITPLISLGSTALHSLLQLRLGGPNNTFTTFVSVGKNKSNIPVPCLENFEQLVADISCKSLSSIMNVLLQSAQKTYEMKKRPFNDLVIKEKTAYHIGWFIQEQMILIIYLGYLLNINPFDQPDVELYKKETRKLLQS